MTTSLTGIVNVVAQGIHSESSAQLHNLGETVFSNDGRAYRYCKAGATALVKGKLQQSSAEDTATQNLTAVAAAIGATEVSASTTVTITANEYSGGYVVVTVTPDQGSQYLIKGHAAYTAAAPTLTLSDPLLVAWTTGTRIDLVRNPYASIVVNPTTLTSAPVGVAVYNITAAYFGWLQVGGIATILSDGGDAVGSDVVASNATAGAVEDAASSGAQPIVGTAITGVATTEYGAYKLRGLL